MKLCNAIVSCVVGAAAVAMLGSAPAGGVEVGKPAPNFTATDSNGKNLSLSDFKGKIVVLEWTNPDCPYVRSHYQGNMQALQKTYTEKGVVWLTVDSSRPGSQGSMTADQANALIKSTQSHQTRFLLDADGAVGKLYEARTTPHMFVIDQQGVLRYDGAIDAARSSRAADHRPEDSYVAKAIEAILAGKEIETTKTQPYGCAVKY